MTNWQVIVLRSGVEPAAEFAARRVSFSLRTRAGGFGGRRRVTGLSRIFQTRIGSVVGLATIEGP
jgi:hypothetical protein